MVLLLERSDEACFADFDIRKITELTGAEPESELIAYIRLQYKYQNEDDDNVFLGESLKMTSVDKINIKTLFTYLMCIDYNRCGKERRRTYQLIKLVPSDRLDVWYLFGMLAWANRHGENVIEKTVILMLRRAPRQNFSYQGLLDLTTHENTVVAEEARVQLMKYFGDQLGYGFLVTTGCSMSYWANSLYSDDGNINRAIPLLMERFADVLDYRDLLKIGTGNEDILRRVCAFLEDMPAEKIDVETVIDNFETGDDSRCVMARILFHRVFKENLNFEALMRRHESGWTSGSGPANLLLMKHFPESLDCGFLFRVIEDNASSVYNYRLVLTEARRLLLDMSADKFNVADILQLRKTSCEDVDDTANMLYEKHFAGKIGKK